MTPQSLPRTRSRIAFLLTALAIVSGGGLRLIDLGGPHFTGDELDHYYAAQSLKEIGEPLLPSGHRYERGADITRLVSVTTSVIDDPELAARLPSALFGILGLVLIAWTGWKMGGPWAAFWATTFLAVYPEAVIQGRQTRFYTYQLCFALVALYAGWRCTDPTETDSARRRWIWASVAVGSLLMGVRAQPSTLSVVVGWGVALVGFASWDLYRHGARAWRENVAGLLLLMGAVVALGALAVAPGRVDSMIRLASHVPAWAGGGGDPRTYYWALSDSFPELLALAPVSWIVVWLHRPRLAVHLLCWFAVPVIVHSLLFPWKAERYVFAAMPAFLLASAVAAGQGTTGLWRTLSVSLSHRWHRLDGIAAARLGAVLVLAAGSFAVITGRAFNEARDLPGPRAEMDWTLARTLIEAEGLENAPLGASQPLVPMFYWGRLDFVVGRDFLENRARQEGDPLLRPDGAPDWYAGLPVWTHPTTIAGAFGGRGPVVIGIERTRWEHGNITPDLRRVLETEGRELCGGRCGYMLLFVWSPAAPPP